MVVIILAAAIGSGAMVGIMAYFMNRMRNLETGAPKREGVLAELEDVRERLDSTESELASLKERQDFTDRLLMRGDAIGSDSTDEAE